jgi:hypothetical protein
VSNQSPQNPLSESQFDANLLQRLQNWFAAQCDGEREHQYGITIESCDNPGWWVKIDLAGTSLQSQYYPPVRENVDDADCQLGTRWLCCRVTEHQWHGSGDETKLPLILQCFLDWAESAVAHDSK